MRTFSSKAIGCTISRGGFSDERVFAIALNGRTHEGVASRRFMWNENGEPISEGEPPIGQQISGFVAARILQVLKDRVLASIPDGEVVELLQSELVDRPSNTRTNVLV